MDAPISSRLVRRPELQAEPPISITFTNPTAQTSLGDRLIRPSERTREFSDSDDESNQTFVSPYAHKSDASSIRSRLSKPSNRSRSRSPLRQSESAGRDRERSDEEMNAASGGDDEMEVDQQAKERRQRRLSSRPRWVYDQSLQWSCVLNNPHIAQAHVDDPSDTTRIRAAPLDSFRRVLLHGTAGQTDGDTQGVYRRRAGELKSVIHWEARSKLIADLEFLLLHGYPHCNVVCAGASPGVHITFLASLFPDFTFHVFDARLIECDATDRILMHTYDFTDDVAVRFAGMHALLISDICSANPLADTPQEVEEKRVLDMAAQRRWVKLMKAHRSALRFRLPWMSGVTEYLDGDIYLPAWGLATTAEATLIVSDNDSVRVYDNQKFEGQMFHFNTYTRVQLYAHVIAEIGEGLDHCFDCRSEVQVIDNYLHFAARRARSYGLNLYPPREIYAFPSEQAIEQSNGTVTAPIDLPPLNWTELWDMVLADQAAQVRPERVSERTAELSAEMSRELAQGKEVRTLAHRSVVSGGTVERPQRSHSDRRRRRRGDDDE